MTDIEIARGYKPERIEKIAEKLGIADEALDLYGKYAAKVAAPNGKRKGKLILVTAMNPTPYGEGKTTVSIGLADAFALLNKKVCLALREPSLGPVFGVKGGATGGGYSQVVPMEDINLHFTGDFHAITAADNLLSALIDNHLKQGNPLNIKTVTWRRAMDMNDRALRFIECGLGGDANGVPREDGFDITAASEVMSVFCLSSGVSDLKRRLGNIVIGSAGDGKPVRARDLKAEESMTILLYKAFSPNLVQTLGGTPAFIHGGPFANIAHGCNSVAATDAALRLADYVVTEAGFGAELGAEKFFDIKCRKAGLNPSAVVLVVTARSLKYNGGAAKADVNRLNMAALAAGICNMEGHVENLKKFGIPVTVAINRFITDAPEELDYIRTSAAKLGATAVITDAWADGGKGCTALAEAVLKSVKGKTALKFIYADDDSPRVKIEKVACEIYGAAEVDFSDKALAALAEIEKQGLNGYPVCIAKTQYSFSADQTLLGRPKGFTLPVRDIYIRAGAEFLVAVCGSIMLMPGLPKVPNSDGMKINSETLEISGLF
ncbi:MAG: formate--tetrahydrofolate ligase [Clostridiaceae bacterium]|jgi:formate--tetrahydrofolate ligase|nr:formate--tetrahydrofolate ligase [Clostridiaceae bacterium]